MVYYKGYDNFKFLRYTFSKVIYLLKYYTLDLVTSSPLPILLFFKFYSNNIYSHSWNQLCCPNLDRGSSNSKLGENFFCCQSQDMTLQGSREKYAYLSLYCHQLVIFPLNLPPGLTGYVLNRAEACSPVLPRPHTGKQHHQKHLTWCNRKTLYRD